MANEKDPLLEEAARYHQQATAIQAVIEPKLEQLDSLKAVFTDQKMPDQTARCNPIVGPHEMSQQHVYPLIIWLLLAKTLPVLAAVRTVVSYRSPATGLTLKATVLLPDSYAKQPAKRYPVLYMLHGHTGNFTS